jgi:hypothetical protein
LDGDIADLRTICGDDDSTERVAVPAELQPFVGADAAAVEWHKVDLNLDGRPDYFLVVEHNCDDRTVLLVVRKADGTLSLAASNDDLIICRSCNGQYDGYSGALVERGQFTIEQSTGSAAGSSQQNVSFAWSKKKKTWVVSAAESSACDRDTGCGGGKEPLAIGVPFEEYRSDKNYRGDAVAP